LNHATFPYLKRLADHGFVDAVKGDLPLAKGVNTHKGHCTYKAVADAHNLKFTPIAELLGA
ncbi:MAG: alanine dehydrogenase, partial [Deltaproteobacteria bacterium]|nr:alanine dehydrogenase [Deltaproteobacteria bacterium]